MAAIGNGTVAMARDFAEQFHVGFPLFTDPERKSYAAAQWRRPLASAVLGLGAVLKNGARARKGGFKQGRVQGDAFALGGVLVVDPQGRVLFEHSETAAGDHADVDDVVTALKRS